MKPHHFGLLFLATALTGGPAVAYDCNSNTTADPSGTSYSLIFDGVEGFFAEVDAPAQCDVSAPINALPTGVIAVYSADYRGFLDSNATGRIRIFNTGRVSGVELTTEDDALDGLIYAGYVGSNGSGTAIDSLIDLELLDYADFGSLFSLDSIDYAELARTTVDDLQASVDELAIGRIGLVTHLNATFDLLTGFGRPFDADDGIEFVGGVGSVTAGGTGRLSVTPAVSVQAGIAFVDQQAAGSGLTGALAAVSLRAEQPATGDVRGFGELGIRSAPALGITLSRPYETSTGTTLASGRTTGAFLGAYVTGGVLISPNPSNEIVFSGSLSRDLLVMAAYDETLDGSNLFAASVPGQVGTFDTAKIGATWTTRPADRFELTLSGALGMTMARTPLSADIAFAGSFESGTASEAFAEYGVRAGYRLTPEASIGAFVHAATGAVSGTHAQVGGDLRVQF